MKRILFVDDRIPAPFLGAGYPRAYKMLHMLIDLGYKISFFPLQSQEIIEPYTIIFRSKGIEILFNDSEVENDIVNFLSKRKNFYDLVLISRPHNAKKIINIIRKIFPEAPIIYDAEALFMKREILKLQLAGEILSKNEMEKMIDDEIELMQIANAVITVSNKEKEEILKNIQKDIFVWGYPSNIRPSSNNFNVRKDILFVGSFHGKNSPNEDSIHYFVNEIFPLIREHVNVKLYVVGYNKSQKIKSLNSETIIVTGKLENIEEYYNKCKVFIVPTRFAAGIPLKLLETMSYGLPAVVTPLIADQLGLTEGKEVFIGTTPKDFADKVLLLYNNERSWVRLRNCNLDYINKYYNPSSMNLTLNNIIKSVLN